MAGQYGPHQDHVHIEHSSDDLARFNYFYLARSALIQSADRLPLYHCSHTVIIFIIYILTRRINYISCVN